MTMSAVPSRSASPGSRPGASARSSGAPPRASGAGPRTPAPNPQRFTENAAPRSGPAESSPSEAPILFQDYFKSPGPRTYAAQVKRAKNDNHFLVITEGKRDEKTGDVRKNKILIFSEDFSAFFAMIEHAAQFIRANPVAPEVAQRQRKFWNARKNAPPAGDR